MPHIVSLPVGYMDILEKKSVILRLQWKMRVTFPAEDGNYTGYKDDNSGDDDDNALMAS